MDNNDNNNLVPISRPLYRRRQSLMSRLGNFSSFLNDSDEDEVLVEQRNLISNLRTNTSESSLETIERLSNNLKKEEKEKRELKKYKESYKKMVSDIPRYIIKHICSHNKCSICLEEGIDFDNIYVITGCFHIFHEKCIKESQHFNFRCPLCRNNLRNSFYKKVQLNISDMGIDNF